MELGTIAVVAGALFETFMMLRWAKRYTRPAPVPKPLIVVFVVIISVLALLALSMLVIHR